METRSSVDSYLKWILLFVVIGSFLVLCYGTKKTYTEAPPIPKQIINEQGTVILEDSAIIAGKGNFQKADLMDYGSLYGMGSSFGIDYTAQYAQKLGAKLRNSIANQRYTNDYNQLSPEIQAGIDYLVAQELHNIKLTDGVTKISNNLSQAIVSLQAEISQNLLTTNPQLGYSAALSLTRQSSQSVASFLLYSALTTVANRPNLNYSYTNNWPYDPSIGNRPTTGTFTWTWISITLLVFGIGVVLFIYQRFLKHSDGDASDVSAPLLKFRPLLPSQKAIAPYFFIVAIVLLLQVLAGAIMAHYYTERSGFYGIDILKYLPFNFLRDIHTQTPIIWIGLSWIGSALFIAPIISRVEAKWQHILIWFLFIVTVIVVAGAVVGNYLGIMGIIDKGWFWIGNQGLSYLQLGRLWQIGFFIGLMLWSIIVFRGMWPTKALAKESLWQYLTGNIKGYNP